MPWSALGRLFEEQPALALALARPPVAAVAVDQDATSGIYVPSTAAQFTALGITAPQHLYLCQEASGDLADSIGGVTWVANASPTYQQAVTGWTRKAVRTGNGSVGQRFTAGSGVGPSPGSTSVAILAYVDITASTASRWVMGMGASATDCGAYVTSAGILGTQVISTNNTATSDARTGGVRPILLVFDRAGTLVKLFSDQDAHSGTYSASVGDGQKGIGAFDGDLNAAGADYLWACMFSGASAAALSANATAKSYLQALGWTIPWS